MSSYAFRQEFMASFEAMGSEMFKEDWVQVVEEDTSIGDYYIAVDLAGFQEVTKKKSKNSRLDSTAIAVVKVNEGGWVIEDIIYGRWTLDVTAKKIFDAYNKYRPVALGIEKGIARQAVTSPLTDMMKRTGTFFNIHELTHGNQKKTDRIMWALQGRFEHGMVKILKGDWNMRFLDELFQFPDPLTHDDCVDAVAYIDQLAKVAYAGTWETYDDFETLDAIAGY